MTVQELIVKLAEFPVDAGVLLEEGMIVVVHSEHGKGLYQGEIGAIYPDGTATKEGTWHLV